MRLEEDRLRHLQQRDVNPDMPLFEQATVHSKMLNFHSKVASLKFYNCTSCFERFPNLAMAGNTTMFARCNRDQRIPKLYSAANNIDPGAVPPQLQVSIVSIVLKIEACIMYLSMSVGVAKVLLW